MANAAVIFGFEGLELTQSEHDFFRDLRPWGYIVFARNIDTPAQLRRLTDDLRVLDGRDDLPILVDQEGGSVARLRPPQWREIPTAARFGELYDRDQSAALEAVQLNSRLIASELSEAGINVDCLPVLDVCASDGNPFLNERTYGANAAAVAALGRAAANGLLEGGVLPVMKHMPGHGRGTADSHFELPRVTCSAADLSGQDFAPFAALAELPLAMTGHIVFEAYDPQNAATVSKNVIEEVIRRLIGFDGLLMTDDFSMKALEGDFEARTIAAYEAGCEVILHCNGDRTEMDAVASAVRPLEGVALRRADTALSHLNSAQSI